MKKWKWFISLLLIVIVCFSAIQVYAEKAASETESSEAEEPFIVDSKEWRQQKAKELKLENWIDEEGYLMDGFYENKSDKELEDMELHGLVRSVTPEEMDIYTARLNAGIAAYTVTYYEKIQEGYNITGVFEVDGRLAFCVQHSKLTPPAGSPTSAPELVTNDNLRKVLYYGYNGPATTGYSYVQTAMAASQANGDASGNTGARVLAEIQGKASPPGNFKVWKVQTNGGTTQDLAYYTVETKGKAKIKKISGAQDITNENNCYSREGAVYGLYTNEACTVKKTSFTTGANGEAAAQELERGTYYIKEQTAPKGYALSSEVKTVSVQPEQETSLEVTDYPQQMVIDILLQKQDAQTTDSKPQGQADFSDAQFEVKYYKGEYGEEEDPEKKGKEPDRKWIFRTDEEGIVKMEEEYQVSGDDLWKNDAGESVLPLGTVTIQEIKPPQGYHLNPEIFVRKIQASGTERYLRTWQKIDVPENVMKLELLKRQEGTDIPIPKAEFEHICPDGTVERVKTDSEGKLTFRGLRHGKHELREISVMDGYCLNENVIEFIVAEDNEVTFPSKCDDSKGKISLKVTEEGNIQVDMEELPTPFSLVIHKKNNHDVMLEGAEFAIYSDEACNEEVTEGRTDETGVVRLQGLKPGKDYFLKETKAPAGYRLPLNLFGNPVIYKVRGESIPVRDEFTVRVNDESEGIVTVEGTKADREAHISITNDVGFRLPNTGSGGMVSLLAAGMGLCFVSVYRRKKLNRGDER